MSQQPIKPFPGTIPAAGNLLDSLNISPLSNRQIHVEVNAERAQHGPGVVAGIDLCPVDAEKLLIGLIGSATT